VADLGWDQTITLAARLFVIAASENLAFRNQLVEAATEEDRS
jgi:hypothetical protein